MQVQVKIETRTRVFKIIIEAPNMQEAKDSINSALLHSQTSGRNLAIFTKNNAVVVPGDLIEGISLSTPITAEELPNAHRS